MSGWSGKGAAASPSVVARRRRGQPALSYVTGAFGLGVNAMVTFLLPLRASELGVSLGVIGMLVGVKALVEAVLSVPLGAVIDRIGARGSFVLGTALTGIVAVGFAAASSPWGLLVAATALGVVRPLGWIGAQTYIASVGSSADRAHHTGRFSFASSAGQIVAPLLMGGVADATTYSVAFLAVAGYAALFALLGLVLPELRQEAPTSRVSRPHSGVSAAAGLLRRSGIQVALLLTFARLWIPGVWIAFFPLLLVRAGLSPATAGTAVSGMAVVATVTTLAAGRLSRRVTPEIVTATALGLAAAGLAISPLWQAVPGIYLPAVLVGLGQGLSLPLLITIVSGSTPREQRGLALGLRSSVNQAAAAAAPVTAGPLIGAMGAAFGFMACSGAALGLLAGAVVVHLRHRASSLAGAGTEG